MGIGEIRNGVEDKEGPRIITETFHLIPKDEQEKYQKW